MSYQPEERYWTDYLRIALPIAGLLLLLGVFWYWASSLLVMMTMAPDSPHKSRSSRRRSPAATQTATVSAAVTMPAVQTVAPTQSADQTQPTEDPALPTATTEPAENGGEGDGAFAEGDFVVVNDNDVNLRTEPTSGDVITVLSQGDELSILSSTPVDDGTYVWWNVSTVDLEEGWVAGDFLEPSGT